MNKATVRELALARREAAASISWPTGTALLVNPDPAVRKKLKKAAIVVGVLAVCWLIVSDPRGPVHDWTQSVENREMRPSMESAMKAGNLAAGTWLATHYWKDYPGLLEKESDAGDPAAMFIVGRMLLQSEHPQRYLSIEPSLTPVQLKAKGLELIRRAAAAGNQEALQFAIKHGGV